MSTGRQMLTRRVVIALVSISVTAAGLISAGLAIRSTHAASGTVQIAPVVAEVSDGLSNGTSTYTVFSDTTAVYNYASGSVALSTCADGTCTIVADDALKLTVTRPDGTVWTREWDFYTHDQAPADVTAAFQPGNNTVRAQLIDLIGPLEGSPRPFYLVAGTTSIPTVRVTVTKGPHFISQDPSESAQVMLHVHVAWSDGTPISGAPVHLTNPGVFFSALTTTTDAGGNLVAPVDIPPGPLVGNAPITGDVTSSVAATVNGQDFASDPLVLYHGDRLDNSTDLTLTPSEAQTYYLNLLLYNAAQPDFIGFGLSTCSGDFPDAGYFFCNLGTVLEQLFNAVQGTSSNTVYNPQAGDVLRAHVYEYTSSDVTPVYELYESASRGGTIIYAHGAWTENVSGVQQYLPQVSVDRTALVAHFASPVTAVLTDPNGQQLGYDPTADSFVYGELGANSAVGAEPYQLVLPKAPAGHYTLQVTGTANGTYSMDIYSLDSNGNGSPESPISGIAVEGYTDTYFITYPAPAGQTVFVQRKVLVDIQPGDSLSAINLASDGLTPVAILSTPTFDATTVDPGSVEFGPAGVHAARCSVEDINGDGKPDLMCHFKTELTGILPGSTSATLIGQTMAGVYIIGSDSIKTVPNTVRSLRLAIIDSW